MQVLRTIEGGLEPESWQSNTGTGTPRRTHKTTRSAEELRCPLHLLLQTNTPMTPKLDFVRPTKTTTTTRKPLGKRLCTNLLHLLCLSMVPARTRSSCQQSRHSSPAHMLPPSRPPSTGALLHPSQALSVPCPVLEPSTHPNGNSLLQGSCCPAFIP